MGVLGPWEFLWRAGSCIYFVRVCLRCEEWRAGTSIFGHFGGVGGGTVQIFLLLWLRSGGYCTVEMVRGGGPFFPFAFFSLLLVFLAVGYLRWKFCVIYFFVGNFVVFSRGFLFYEVADC